MELADEAQAYVGEESSRILWERGILTHKLWRQQRVIYDTIRALPRSVTIIVILCARQFGKSHLGCLMATEDAICNPGVKIPIIGPSITHTEGIVLPRMEIVTSDIPPEMIKDPFPKLSTNEFRFTNKSKIVLGGFKSRSMSQRGGSIYRAYIEEICESEPDEFLEFMRGDLAPALTHSKSAQIVFLTTLPKIPDHPFNTEIVPMAEANGSLFIFTIDDNEQLSKEQYESTIALCGGRHSPQARRELWCEQIRDASIILAPEFEEKQHVREPLLPRYCNFWLGGDTGGIRDKSVFHLCAYDFERAKVLFLDERAYDPETGSGDMVLGCRGMESQAEVAEWLEKNPGKSMPRYVDAHGQTQVDFAVLHNYPVTLPKKDELEASINQLRVALKRNEIEISPKCRLLIMTLRSGTFNKTRTDLARTTTLGHMDAAASAVYCLRHANKNNPFPPLGDGNPYTHYVHERNEGRHTDKLRQFFS